MKNMTIENIAFACHGKLYHGKDSRDIEIKGVEIDSRKVADGYLFIATRGERVDGHSFIEAVISKGAVCVVCEEKPIALENSYKEEKSMKDKNSCKEEKTYINEKNIIETIPYILVENSFIALKQIAAYYREQLSIKVVGITGSVGKTTTKEFIASVVEQKYKVLKTAGNFNNEVGLPLTVLQIRDYHQVAILEMGISDFGEMDRLGAIAKPDICVITNIGQSHLEQLGTREGILKAKTEVLPHIKKDGYLCINGDDELLATIPSTNHSITFGLSNQRGIYAADIENQGLLGSKCVIHTDLGTFKVQVPLAGQHMIYNALAATTVGELLGLDQWQIAEGLKEVKALGGRSHIFQSGRRTIIDDCYNANPVSMKASLDILSLATTRKVAILGDMGELGTHSDKLHSEVGTYAVEKQIDLLICIGESASFIKESAVTASAEKHVLEEVVAKQELEKVEAVKEKQVLKETSEKLILEEISEEEIIESERQEIEPRLVIKKDSQEMEIEYFLTKEQAIIKLSELLLEEDTVLVKASRFMGLEAIVKELSC